MADNVAITAGSGTTIAADDIGGVLHQRIKLGLGADGSATDALGGTGAASAAVLRTVSASDDPIITAINATNAQLPAALGATTAANSLAVTLDTTIKVVEDAAAAADPTGIVGMAVRRDTLSSSEVSADGDNVALKATSKGQLHVMEEDKVSLTPASVTSATTIFTQDMTGFGSITVQVTSAGTSCTITYETSDDNSTYTATPGTRVDSLGLNANQAVTTSTTAVQTKFGQIGKYFRARVSTYGSGTVTVVATLHKEAFASTISAYIGQTLAVGGNVAHDSAVSGSPVRVGVRALTSNYTAVATGDVADLVSDVTGSLVVLPYGIPDLTWHYASAADVTDTTSTEMKGAVASTRNYLTTLSVCNTDATVGTYVNILSAATLLFVVYVAPQTASTAGQNSVTVTFPVPIRSAVNEALNFQAVTTSAQLRVGAVGFSKAA